MKYIDADRLKAEIKRQIRLEELNFAALGGGGQTFCINTLEWVLKRIDSLQQEQPEVDIEKFISDFIDKKDSENHGKWCEEDIIEAMKESFEFRHNTRKQPKIDLEKEINKAMK